MRNIIIFIIFLCFVNPFVYAEDDIDDDSIITELEKIDIPEKKLDFSMNSFDSCSAFEDVMEEYLKTYWENSYNNRRDFLYSPVMMEAEMVEDSAVSAKSASNDQWWTDVSETNTQVAWVDESDIVKTDGNFHYYYNEEERAVFIIEASENGFFTDESLKIVKKINLPKTFSAPQLYVTENRLVVISSAYSNTDYSKSGYYINRNSKTYTIVFDTSDKSKPQLLKLYGSDGYFSKSRRIWDYVYVLSQNSLSYPYWNIKSVDDIELDAESLIPKQIDISKTSLASQQNLVIKDTQLPYNISAWNIADCSSINYSFPDEETLKNTNFNPGYNIISAINIEDVTEKVETTVIAGSNSEIYMSQDNLYMTESIWQTDSFSCPPNALCARPFFWGWSQNTLVHKLNIDKENIAYQDSALVPWAPLNQYSMDEHEWDFRIITSEWSPERSTGLYVLDSELEPKSNLTELAPGETFQSSRFIGDKLFLVTFEQIDPLFVIDLSDSANPEVLWELKIPGFSTYLHPYDENHLIWLWYDTQINEWWGTTTAWVKADLYKINYDKKCGDSNLTATQEEKCESGDYKGIIVEQLYTETLWGKWSYSEALSNPRMFVWNQNRNTLLLPVTLYEKDDDWRTKDFYEGLVSIKIDADKGIEVLNKVSHIDTKGAEELRDAECEKYVSNSDPVCEELWNGEMYCEDDNDYRGYVPNYCFKDSTVMAFIWDNSWKYRNQKIKRALYVGENVYAISDSKISSYDWELNEKQSVEF